MQVHGAGREATHPWRRGPQKRRPRHWLCGLALSRASSRPSLALAPCNPSCSAGATQAHERRQIVHNMQRSITVRTVNLRIHLSASWLQTLCCKTREKRRFRRPHAMASQFLSVFLGRFVALRGSACAHTALWNFWQAAVLAAHMRGQASGGIGGALLVQRVCGVCSSRSGGSGAGGRVRRGSLPARRTPLAGLREANEVAVAPPGPPSRRQRRQHHLLEFLAACLACTNAASCQHGG